MNGHDVQHRDCFASLAAMKAAGGVRLIVTSPPYPDARTPEQYGCAGFDTTVEGSHGVVASGLVSRSMTV